LPSNSDADILLAVQTEAKQLCASHDAAHDDLHLARVVANAMALADDEEEAGRPVDRFVIQAAGWLHDLVQLPKGTGAPGESARQSSARADQLLASLGVSSHRRRSVLHAIEIHSFSGGLCSETLDAAIVQDADRLDALGAIGIARLWVTGASLGGVLYSADDPLAERRELDDRVFGLDHIERKLLKLPETMNTASGRKEAARRAEYVRTYRAEFLRELGVR